MTTIGTHSGSCHLDDATGVSILLHFFPDARVVRSRDPAVLAACDYLVDVGGEFDPARNRFDHHQKGFAERRPNGIPYAGAGLVWASYGEAYVRSVSPSLEESQVQWVAQEIDARLVQYADAVDSGVLVEGPLEFQLSCATANFNATWLETEGSETDDERFDCAASFAGTVLHNLTRVLTAEVAAATLVRAAPRYANGQILVLDVARIPYDRVVCEEMPDVLFVVYPESRGQQYQVRVVPQVLGQFVARLDLPEAWAGLRDDRLAEVTGVADAVFCHNGRFICGAQSLDGALALAHLALPGRL